MQLVLSSGSVNLICSAVYCFDDLVSVVSPFGWSWSILSSLRFASGTMALVGQVAFAALLGSVASRLWLAGSQACAAFLHVVIQVSLSLSFANAVRFGTFSYALFTSLLWIWWISWLFNRTRILKASNVLIRILLSVELSVLVTILYLIFRISWYSLIFKWIYLNIDVLIGVLKVIIVIADRGIVSCHELWIYIYGLALITLLAEVIHRRNSIMLCFQRALRLSRFAFWMIACSAASESAFLTAASAFLGVHFSHSVVINLSCIKARVRSFCKLV